MYGGNGVAALYCGYGRLPDGTGRLSVLSVLAVAPRVAGPLCTTVSAARRSEARKACMGGAPWSPLDRADSVGVDEECPTACSALPTCARDERREECGLSCPNNMASARLNGALCVGGGVAVGREYGCPGYDCGHDDLELEVSLRGVFNDVGCAEGPAPSFPRLPIMPLVNVPGCMDHPW